MDDGPSPSLHRRAHFIDRVPSWVFLASLGGLVVLLWLLSLINRPFFYDGFVKKYLWEPIVVDEGYNPVNTAGLMVVLGFILLWLYRLMHELNENVDLELSVAVIPYLVWGSIFRVLEDSDLFAPFNSEIVAVGRESGSSCVPQVGGSFLHQCFGVFFITPIIYVEITILAVLFLLLGHQARKVGQRSGLGVGLQFYALTLAGLFALYLAVWAANPTDVVRFVPNPLVMLFACLVAFWIVWREASATGRINPHWCLFAYSTIFLILGAYYVVVWMNGGHGSWAPDSEVQWWIFGALIFAPLFLAYSSAKKGRALSGAYIKGEAHPRRAKQPDRAVRLLTFLLILEGFAIFISLLGAHSLEDELKAGRFGTTAAVATAVLFVGPVTIYLFNGFARVVASGPFGVHPALIFFANPVNLLMVFGQSADALMTSLGIDVFHYTEKHVLPRNIIAFVDWLNLPAPFADYPAALGMIPLKLLIVLGVVYIIDVSFQGDTPERKNLIGLVKLAIVMVGLAPGARDGVRLAMGT